MNSGAVELIDDLPAIQHAKGSRGGPLAVDHWISSPFPWAQRRRMRAGVDMMQDTEPEPPHAHYTTGFWKIRGLEDTGEAHAFRVCPRHLTPLNDELLCTEGHTCDQWMVRVNRRIEFDAREFKAEWGGIDLT